MNALAAYRSAENEKEGWKAYINAQIGINRSEIVGGGVSPKGNKTGGLNTTRKRAGGIRTSGKSKSATSQTVIVSGQVKKVETGSRGGKYYINKNGNKTYLKRNGTKRD